MVDDVCVPQLVLALRWVWAAAALASTLCAAGTLLPEELEVQGTVEFAAEAWRWRRDGWKVEAEREAQASAAEMAVGDAAAAVDSVGPVEEPAVAQDLAEVDPVPGSAEEFPKPGPHGNKSTLEPEVKEEFRQSPSV